MGVADASSSGLDAALLRLRPCVLAPLAPRTPHSRTLFIDEPLGQLRRADAEQLEELVAAVQPVRHRH